jgi:WD40 repeat protein
MSKADEMKRVRFLVSNWLTRIDVENSVDYFDINKAAENVARRLLNQLLDLELDNLNLTKKRNFPGIDLARESGFAVQITSQKTAEKIRDSLEKFEKNELYKNYPKGVRFLILCTAEPNFRKETLESFTRCYRDFNPNKHIWTKSWLLKQIDYICNSDLEDDRERFKVIADILEEEFGAGENWQERSSSNLLSHLPPISEEYTFPRPPFRYLRRYKREDARIFFGRSNYIWELFEKVTRTDSAPVTLLYGQSGVGKSSLLEAGLLPRIEGFSNVIYTQRNLEKGLAGTVTDAMNDFLSGILTEPQSPLLDTWKQIETQTGKPLIIIIDQAEEVFTAPNPNLPHELYDFIGLLKGIFKAHHSHPRGRLVLGYRKEFHAEIENVFNKEGITDYSVLFLEPIDREGILEVASGLTHTPVLRDRYNLRVQEWLPDIISNDLSIGKPTPVAPVLQFIMSKLWEMSLPNDSGVREFTIDGYRTLRENGMAMKDFFRMQMEALESWNQEVVTSGLALDILKYHTTNMGTSCSRKMEELRTVYRNRLDILATLIAQLKNLYLLTNVWESEKLSDGGGTTLAHDILAPVVINEYNVSNRPSQRASRILAAKIWDFERNKDKTWLDENDLEIVEKGRDGMKSLEKNEEDLLKLSWKHKLKSEKIKKRNKTIRVSLTILVIIIAILAVIQWNIAEEQRSIAEKNEKEANARRLAVIAGTVAEEDPTIALRIAEKAWLLDKNQDLSKTIFKIYSENSFYKIIARHEKWVYSVAFSPDGKTILIGSRDNTARLLDIKGNLIQKFIGFYGPLTFSPDGTTILIGSADNTARLWDLQGKKVQEFKGHKKWVYSVAFSPDGKTILTGSADKTARLWDLQGRTIQELKGHTREVTSVAFSPDGKTILTGSADNTARLWNLRGKIIKGLKGHTKSVSSVVFSPDGNTILTGSWDHTARLWDQQGNMIQEFKRHKGILTAVAFSPDGNIIFTGSWEDTPRLWDLQGNMIQELKGHKALLTSATFSPDGNTILTGSRDGTARLWDHKGNIAHEFKVNKDFISSVAFSPKGNAILTSSWESPVRLWDLEGNIIQEFKGHKKPVISVAFSPDGKTILTSSWDSIPRLWNMKGSTIQEFKGHLTTVYSVAFSPDGKTILTGSKDNTARLWDLQGNTIQEFKGHKSSISSVAFSPDGKTILTGFWDNTACLWDLQGKMKKEFNGHKSHITSVAFSPDGKTILTGSGDNTARLWDLHGKTIQEFKGHKSSITSVTFSPNGTTILTGSKDYTVRLWDLRGYTVQEFKGHRHEVHSVTFSPHGKTILTGSYDGTARLWYVVMPLEDFLKKGNLEPLSAEQKRKYGIEGK